jgi:hypothetical protein
MSSNRLYGKKIVALGDSLFHGSKDCVGNTWLEMMARRNNMELYNYGINGCTIAVQHAEERPFKSMCERYVDMEDGADYVVVLGGANDRRVNILIGEDDSTDTDTFCGGLNALILGLTAKYPKARILFMTNYNRYMSKNKIGLSDIDYVEAMKRVCGRWSIPCFDNYHDCGLSFQNPAHLAWMDEGIARGGDANRHFSAEAYEWLSYKYEALLETL